MNENLERQLERFISEVLTHIGEWDGLRESDGFNWFEAIQDSEGELQTRGKIWHINQKFYQFWLEIHNDSESAQTFAWQLFYDVLPDSPVPKRHLDSAVEVVGDPKVLKWRRIVFGTGQKDASSGVPSVLSTNIRNQPED